MPLITEEPELGQLSGFKPQVDEVLTPEVDPSIGEIFGAAFRTGNSLVSAASSGFGLTDSFTPEPGYDPYEGDIEGYEIWAENFIESMSPLETANIKMRIDFEQQDRETLDAGGGTAIVAQIAAGITDPVYWPLFFFGGPAIKTSQTVAEAGLRTAAIGGLSEVPAEFLKHQTQETRTTTETAFAIGGATILSGILGAAAKGLSGAEINAISRKLDDVMGPEPTDIVAGNAVEGAADKSMGAAQTVALTKEQLKPVSIGGLEKLGVSPLLRAESSPSLVTNGLAAEMMESATLKQANVDGISTTPAGGSAETRIKMWDAGLYQGMKDLDGLYTNYRQGLGPTRRLVNDVVLRNRKGKLTFLEFREQVGRTLRRGDKSDIPEVQQAAESFRKNVLDPLKDAAISEKLLPPGVDVSTATSYLTRVYNVKKITAKRPEWDAIVERWLHGTRSSAKAKLLAKGKAEGKTDKQLELEAAMTDAEIKMISQDITNNITGVAGGRSPYEIIQNVRGPLKERTFNIPDERIEDFLESDIDTVSRQYVRTMAPDVELTRLFGKADMEDELIRINESYEPLIKAAKTEKERTKLSNQRERDGIDIAAMRDRLRGTYRTPEDPNNFFIRAGRVLRDVNFVRMLGGMTLSAIPDLARPVAVNGFRPVARGLRALATNPKQFFKSRDEAVRSGVGLDMVLNGRAASMAEITDIYGSASAFERGLRGVSDVFSKLTLMTQWNSALKQFAGVVTQDRILKAAVDVAGGTASKSTIKRLASAGIGKDEAKDIAAQFIKHGDDGDLRLSNGHKWDDQDTLETFRAAVLKDVDRAIVTPGQGEKPLWTSSETGKMIFQFKTFAAVAHNKILVADLQYRDASALNGLLLSVALGSAADGAKQFVAGREISTDPSKVLVESLDRSGLFGYFWDVNNMLEKFSRGEAGVNRLVGAPPMSRYASRNIMGALLGPSLGTVQDLNTVRGAIAQGELTESDVHTIRKLLPGQNLFYIRQLLNSLEEKVQ